MPTDSQAAAPRPRQQAGLACDECRRRKLRCDREQPQCGVCRDSATECIITTTRQPRGPRKGHLRALQSRIVALESRISNEQGSTSDTNSDDGFSAFPDEIATPMSTSSLPSGSLSSTNGQSFMDLLHTESYRSNSHGHEKPPLIHHGSSSYDSGIDLTSNPDPSSMVLPMIGLSPVYYLSDLMRSDLDHLYFDRLHNFFPILNKRHYFARARQPRPAHGIDAFQCLQHAMWTLAVSTSSQFQGMQDELYTYTRLIIDNLETELLQADCIQLEQVQAWALLSIYEFMRVEYRRGWLSAGKCFRFAILMKLHNVDGSDGIAAASMQNLTAVEIEERRRTFWMAYTIDRIISLLDQLPLTFDHHVILTRRPCPEKEFQSGEPVIMEFLSDLLHGSQAETLSTFTESIRLVTLCGQLLSHQQQGTVEHTHCLISLDFWNRQQQLDLTLDQTVKSMSCNIDPHALGFLDPMEHFTMLAAQAAVLMLFKASQTAPWGLENHDDVAADYESRAMAAAQQMITLSKSLVELTHFKIHPFAPVLLYFCGDFLSSNPHLDPTFEMQIALDNVLRGLSQVNQIASKCLEKIHMVR